ncbi:MAG: response regulator [Planctomycetota bacterium]|nr:MAG: response regulator [Planctomycetota bacterium]
MDARVLVVDDAKFMRHMIKNILTEIGCEVIGEAGDGQEACTLYEQLSPDVVTMDIVMPNVSGIDALKEIRRKDPKAKIVMISAIDQREPLMEALKLGAVDYVVKPFEKERVKEAMQRVLSA